MVGAGWVDGSDDGGPEGLIPGNEEDWGVAEIGGGAVAAAYL